MKKVKGYKVFNADWTCRGFQYVVGETFEEDATPACCNKGLDRSECNQICWNSLSEMERNIIRNIPNFDEVIFSKITGIEIEKED